MPEVLILANSNKTRGRCVAGVIIDDPNGLRWVRPVSDRDDGALLDIETRVANRGRRPEVQPGDVVQMSFGETRRTKHHPEDVLFVPGWRLVRELDVAEIDRRLEPIMGALPSFDVDSDHIRYRSIPETGLSNSLSLLRCDQVTLTRSSTNPTQVRAMLRFGDHEEPKSLSVTDRGWLTKVPYGMGKEVVLGRCLVTVSLAERWTRGDGVECCYKLVAAIQEFPASPTSWARVLRRLVGPSNR